MDSKAVRILNRFYNNFTLTFSRIITLLHDFANSLKDKISSKHPDKDQLENKIRDMAEILVNMVVIGKEKRSFCAHYDVTNGLCKYVKMDVEIPTLKTVKEGDIHRIAVSIHPEVCAVCPFWVKKLT